MTVVFPYALLFLYQQVLGIQLPRLDAVRAKRPKRLPTVLSPEQVRRFLEAVQGGDGLFRLMASLLYGTGMRRQECCELRVHDLDLERRQLTVRHGKGGKAPPAPSALSTCSARCPPMRSRQLLKRPAAWHRRRTMGLARDRNTATRSRHCAKLGKEKASWSLKLSGRGRSVG
ncbi:MAG: tyrosine-type recombinase/integrase [Gemmataceae bacterium]|nr:tyrosine-type recombinase/integrase [Gemmataceae bacterium]